MAVFLAEADRRINRLIRAKRRLVELLKIRQVIAEEIPAKVAADTAYQNAMKHSDRENARIEHDRALQRVIVGLLADHTELFKQYSGNAAFKKWLADAIFSVTYAPPAA